MCMQIPPHMPLLIGAAGFLCGTGYSIAKQNPETVLPILKLSAASGVAGALLGWGISAYRSSPTHIHVLSLGANFAVTSAIFLSMTIILYHDWLAHAVQAYH